MKVAIFEGNDEVLVLAINENGTLQGYEEYFGTEKSDRKVEEYDRVDGHLPLIVRTGSMSACLHKLIHYVNKQL